MSSFANAILVSSLAVLSDAPQKLGEGRAFFWTMQIMPLYRCHFLDGQDRIKAHEEIDAGSLPEAIDCANNMLNERSHHDVVEVWSGNRWMYRAGRDLGTDGKLHH